MIKNAPSKQVLANKLALKKVRLKILGSYQPKDKKITVCSIKTISAILLTLPLSLNSLASANVPHANSHIVSADNLGEFIATHYQTSLAYDTLPTKVVTLQNEEMNQQALNTLNQAQTLLQQKKPKAALTMLDKVITTFNQYYQAALADKRVQVYTPNSINEVVAYQALAEAENKTIVAGSILWNDALYLKAYALVEMGELDNAIDVLNTAIKLAPYNGINHNELGHIYQLKRKWQAASNQYAQAVRTSKYAEPAQQVMIKTRGLRGLGYVAVEKGELDMAEAYYNQSLLLNPNDRLAQAELQYIKQLRDQQLRAK